jgi:hypothetical protein
MNSKSIRFTSNVFEQRVRVCTTPSVTSCQHSHTETCDWLLTEAQMEPPWWTPKPKSGWSRWNRGIWIHWIRFHGMSLWSLSRQSFRRTGGVNEALKGTIVEVSFAIRHYCLRDKMFDIFQVNMQQIRIIKLGASIAASGFKRRNAREGLLSSLLGPRQGRIKSG